MNKKREENKLERTNDGIQKKKKRNNKKEKSQKK